MSRVIKRHEPLMADIELSVGGKIADLWPVIAPLVLAVVFIISRATIGPRGLLNEGALTLLALICYISAAVLMVTNLFVKENVLNRLGLIAVAAGDGLGYVVVLHPALECSACKGTGKPDSSVATRCRLCAGCGWLTRDQRKVG